ncbi:hypothetical protein AVEN_48829-1 [Araneus ventricosus]|uniref:Uncharacterized protein n=1 Tax=Araneus ventricosus TaxID=182803 RepID=A0A4Y2AI12_ARAVE|nr:hypothetical protein AVEN_48829-1 [Araneus ventricosus]
MLPLHLFRSSSHPCRCGCLMLYHLHLRKKSVLLSDIQRDVQPNPFPFFDLSRNESYQRVRKGDVQSSIGCDSDLPLKLEVERRNPSMTWSAEVAVVLLIIFI